MKLKINTANLKTNTDNEPVKANGFSLSVDSTKEQVAPVQQLNQTNKLTINTNVQTETKETPVEQGFSVSFSPGKEYNLDDIIFAKRRDNAECPLIIKVNLENNNDVEIIKIITKLILDDYGIKDVTDENYKDLVNQVPDFYHVFDFYFNKYYTYYYNKFYNELINGSISLNTAIEEIIELHDYASEILEDSSKTKAYANVFNKPQVIYDFGTSPDNYTGDSPFINDTEARDIEDILAEDDVDDPNDKIILRNYYGKPLENQTPVYFKRINGETIFGNGNLNLMTMDDYFDMITRCLLLVREEQYVLTSDDKFIDLISFKD